MNFYKTEVQNFLRLTKEQGRPFFVFDTETTGLSPLNADIIQFSAVKYIFSGDCVKMTDEMDVYINPGYPIPEKITEITGISDATVQDAPTAEAVAQAVLAFLGEAPIVVGYNSISFDTGFVEKLYRTINKPFVSDFHLDVLKMARDKFPKPHKLITMAERAGVHEKYTFHSSIDDAKATADVLMFILPLYNESTEEPSDGPDYKICGVKRWRKSATLDRLYISTVPRSSIYYDVHLGTWVVGEGVPEISEAFVRRVVAFDPSVAKLLALS